MLEGDVDGERFAGLATGDIYRGLDRFGRVKDSYWYDYDSSSDVDGIKYGYDRNGNHLWRENTVAASLNTPPFAGSIVCRRAPLVGRVAVTLHRSRFIDRPKRVGVAVISVTRSIAGKKEVGSFPGS